MTRHEWAIDDETRYGIYIVYRVAIGATQPVLWAATSKEGIGSALVQLTEDGDLTPDDRAGVLDGFTGTWIVGPYAAGRRQP